MTALRKAIAAQSDWVRAEVKSYDPGRGVGFLTIASDPRDVFVHVTTLRRGGLRFLRPGYVIECRFGETPNGLAAAEVRHVA